MTLVDIVKAVVKHPGTSGLILLEMLLPGCTTTIYPSVGDGLNKSQAGIEILKDKSQNDYTKLYSVCMDHLNVPYGPSNYEKTMMVGSFVRYEQGGYVYLIQMNPDHGLFVRKTGKDRSHPEQREFTLRTDGTVDGVGDLGGLLVAEVIGTLREDVDEQRAKYPTLWAQPGR